MSTQADQTLPTTQPHYTISVWQIVPWLLWMAVSLGIMAAWFYYRGLENGLPFYLGTAILAVGSLLLFLLAGGRWYQGRTDPARLAEGETQLRPMLALAMLGAGAVLLILAVWLCAAEKERILVLPEVFSLAVMGLISGGVGLALRFTTNSPLSRNVLLPALVTNRQLVGICLMVLGVIFAGLGIYFLISAFRTEFFRYPGGPEGLGLIFIGLAFFGAGLWVQLTLAQPGSTDTMRWIVLGIGSAVGFSLAFFSGIRFIGWSKEYFLTTVRVWQGDAGWRFSVCAYVTLIGLLLLFGSLQLARGDIRNNVIMRRLLYGYVAFLMLSLLAAILVVVNLMVAIVLPANVEWTQSMGIQSLSGSSVKILEGVKDKVTVYVLMARYGPSHLEVRDLLDNCRSVTNKIEVEELSPDMQEGRYRELARTYPELAKQSTTGFQGRSGMGRGLLVVYGASTPGKKQPHVFIADSDLEEGGFGQKPKFMGEVRLMQAIQQLSEGGKNKPKIYFTQGRGEIRVDDADLKGFVPVDRVVSYFSGVGAGEVAARLRKDNYEVQAFFWDVKPLKASAADGVSYSKNSPKDQHEVPEDCSVLVIANPNKAFPKDVLEAIDRYMDKRSGKLMVLTNIGVGESGKAMDDGLIAMCKKYNVELANDFILQFTTDPKELPIEVIATVVPTTQNKVAAQFNKKAFLFTMPRTVKAMKGPSPFQAEEILQVSSKVNGPLWDETDTAVQLDDLRDYVFSLRRRGKLVDKGELPVAVAVTEMDREGKPRPRLIVVGDYGFICSVQMRESPTAQLNYDFFRSSLAWLSERTNPDIGISPRERGIYTPEPKTVGTTAAIVKPLILLALGLGGLGIGIWIVRRK